MKDVNEDHEIYKIRFKNRKINKPEGGLTEEYDSDFGVFLRPWNSFALPCSRKNLICTVHVFSNDGILNWSWEHNFKQLRPQLVFKDHLFLSSTNWLRPKHYKKRSAQGGSRHSFASKLRVTPVLVANANFVRFFFCHLLDPWKICGKKTLFFCTSVSQTCEYSLNI